MCYYFYLKKNLKERTVMSIPVTNNSLLSHMSSSYQKVASIYFTYMVSLSLEMFQHHFPAWGLAVGISLLESRLISTFSESGLTSQYAGHDNYDLLAFSGDFQIHSSREQIWQPVAQPACRFRLTYIVTACMGLNFFLTHY